MVQRENRNNAFAKFGGQTKSIMVFSEMACRGCNFHICVSNLAETLLV